MLKSLSKAPALLSLSAAGLLLTPALLPHAAVALPAAAAPSPTKSTPVPTGGVATERRLHLATVEASSFLWDDFSRFQQNYHPLYLGDDDPKTAWVEGVKGNGEGEWVRLHVTPMEGATRVRMLIRNGYQKTNQLYALNSRLKDVIVTLLPSGVQQKVTLKDTLGFQEVVLTQPSGPLASVELKVGSAYPGSKWDDLTVSDVQLYVTATSPENPAFEKSRLEKLLKWKSDRAAAAAQFKNAVKTNMPVLPQYKVTTEERTGDGSDYPIGVMAGLAHHLQLGEKEKGTPSEEIKLGSQLVANKLADFTPVRVTPVDARPFPTADGLCEPMLNSCIDQCSTGIELPLPYQLGYLSAGGLNTFAEPKTPPMEQVLDGRGKVCQSREPGRTFFYAYRPRSAEGRETLRALMIVSCGKVESREGLADAVRSQLLVYGAKGQLALVVGIHSLSWLQFKDTASGPVLAGGGDVSTGTVTRLSEPDAVAAK